MASLRAEWGWDKQKLPPDAQQATQKIEPKSSEELV